jgi:hypothetical protein
MRLDCDGCGRDAGKYGETLVRWAVPEGKTVDDLPEDADGIDVREASRQGFALVVLCPDCQAGGVASRDEAAR